MSPSATGALSTARDVFVSAEPTPAAPGRVRRALRDAGLDEDLEHTVTLLATEVVANSVRHAGMASHEKIVVYARLAPDHRVDLAKLRLCGEIDRKALERLLLAHLRWSHCAARLARYCLGAHLRAVIGSQTCLG